MEERKTEYWLTLVWEAMKSELDVFGDRNTSLVLWNLCLIWRGFPKPQGYLDGFGIHRIIQASRKPVIVGTSRLFLLLVRLQDILLSRLLAQFDYLSHIGCICLAFLQCAKQKTPTREALEQQEQ